MTISQAANNHHTLDSTVERYANALEKIEALTASKTHPSSEQVLEVLVARDAVAKVLSAGASTDTQTLAMVLELDGRLKKQEVTIATVGQLAEWRKSLHPPESAWWWFFQAPKHIHRWDHWDWIWEALTATVLVLSGSYLFSSLQAFSVGGLGVAETFGTLTQAAGLALVGKGTLTSDGRENVKTSFNKLKIPEHLHSEVMFGLSMLMLVAAYGLHSSLPNISRLYYQQGKESYKQGELSTAEEEYVQASRLDPTNEDITIALGEIYESVGELDKALAQYKQSLKSGYPVGFNHTGRIYIQKKDPVAAETLLRMGLQRVEDDPKTQYQLYRNLGWALLLQKKYQEAQQALELAIEIDRKIPDKKDKPSGSGMANCLLAEVLEQAGNQERATKQWQYCKDYALPETINEYKWFMEVGERNLANQIDTSLVVEGFNRRLSLDNSNQRSAVNELASPAPIATPSEIPTASD